MDKIYESKISLKWGMEAPGIEPGTSRMLSERSTIWATPPDLWRELNNNALKWKLSFLWFGAGDFEIPVARFGKKILTASIFIWPVWAVDVFVADLWL